MRYVSGIASSTAHIAGDELRRVAGIRSVRPVGARTYTAGYSVRHQARAHVLPSAEQGEAGRRAYPERERRLAARRIRHQPVLLELRSGIERRHHNLRDGDIVEHIDVEA